MAQAKLWVFPFKMVDLSGSLCNRWPEGRDGEISSNMKRATSGLVWGIENLLRVSSRARNKPWGCSSWQKREVLVVSNPRSGALMSSEIPRCPALKRMNLDIIFLFGCGPRAYNPMLVWTFLQSLMSDDHFGGWQPPEAETRRSQSEESKPFFFRFSQCWWMVLCLSKNYHHWEI